MRVREKICTGNTFLDWTLHTKWSYTRHNSRLCDDFVQQRRINAHVYLFRPIISNNTWCFKVVTHHVNNIFCFSSFIKRRRFREYIFPAIARGL